MSAVPGVFVGVGVIVGVGVMVGVSVAVPVGVIVAVRVGVSVAVGGGTKQLTGVCQNELLSASVTSDTPANALTSLRATIGAVVGAEQVACTVISITKDEPGAAPK